MKGKALTLYRLTSDSFCLPPSSLQRPAHWTLNPHTHTQSCNICLLSVSLAHFQSLQLNHALLNRTLSLFEFSWFQGAFICSTHTLPEVQTQTCTLKQHEDEEVDEDEVCTLTARSFYRCVIFHFTL